MTGQGRSGWAQVRKGRCESAAWLPALCRGPQPRLARMLAAARSCSPSDAACNSGCAVLRCALLRLAAHRGGPKRPGCCCHAPPGCLAARICQAATTGCCLACGAPSTASAQHGCAASAPGSARPASAPEHDVGEVLLLAGVPLGGQQQRKALAGVGHKAWEDTCGRRARRSAAPAATAATQQLRGEEERVAAAVRCCGRGT